METAPQPSRVTLPRDLSEFLVELSIAIQKHAMYPGGHPSLEDAAAGVTRRAERLFEDRQALVFGVARRQLIIDGVATDPNQPVLRRLAEGLNRHHLGAVTLSQGLQPDEMGQALRALSSEVERDGPLGLAASGRQIQWPHIRLHPLSFDRLEFVGKAPGDGSDLKANALAGELWLGLARAAMATDQPGESAEASAEPSNVAKAIDDHQGAAAYDQVIVGYLLQIANELKSASGAEATALRRRTARLIAALRPETLQRLVEMGGNAGQRREFVLNAASGMAVDAVIEIVKAAAAASGQTISNGLMRMLSKLAEHAELGPEQVRPLADHALRDQVGRLLSGWNLADPNPEAYGKVLQHIATSAASSKGPADAGRRPAAQDDLRIVQMSLEVGEVGPLVERAMDRLIADGHAGSILRVLTSLPAGGATVAGKLLSRMAEPRSIAALVEREPFDADALDQLLLYMPLEGYAVLLDALTTSPNRSTRRKLLDRLAVNEDLGPLLMARLKDDRWYVVRNMLLLLQGLSRLPPGFSPAPWTDHPDPRVRYEAIQLQLRLPEENGLALGAALREVDPRVLRLGLTAIEKRCPGWLASTVAAAAEDVRVTEELRVLAARALGRCGDPAARDALLQLVDGGRTLLGRPKLASSTPICVAALRALAEGWRRDPAAAAVLALAAASADPAHRLAAAGRAS